MSESSDRSRDVIRINKWETIADRENVNIDEVSNGYDNVRKDILSIEYLCDVINITPII